MATTQAQHERLLAEVAATEEKLTTSARAAVDAKAALETAQVAAALNDTATLRGAVVQAAGRLEAALRTRDEAEDRLRILRLALDQTTTALAAATAEDRAKERREHVEQLRHRLGELAPAVRSAVLAAVELEALTAGHAWRERLPAIVFGHAGLPDSALDAARVEAINNAQIWR